MSGIIRLYPKVLLTDGAHEFWAVDIRLAVNREKLTRTHLSPPYG